MDNKPTKQSEHTLTHKQKISPKMWLWVFVGLFVIVGVVVIIRSFAADGTLINGSVSLEGTINTTVIDKLPQQAKANSNSKTSKVVTNPLSEMESNKETAEYEYSLKGNNGQDYKLEFKQGAPTNIIGGSKVKIKGQKSGNTIKIATNDATNFSVVTSATLAPVQTARKVAVVLMNFTDNTAQTTTPDQIKQDVFGATDHYGSNYSVNTYYQANSQGALKLTGNLSPDGDVFGWITLNTTSNVSGCPYTTWQNLANQELANRGVDLTPYSNIIYMAPLAAQCWLGGIAQLPGPTSFISGVDYTDTIAHEFGHNLGLTHANALTGCTDANGFLATTTTINGCSSQEYGDAFDVMGHSVESNLTKSAFLNAQHREQLGWLDSASIVQTTTNGDYVLQDISNPNNSGLRAIKIPVTSRKGGTTYYYIEYKSGLYGGTTSGIMERSYNNVMAGSNTNLLDAYAPTSSVYLEPTNIVAVGRNYKLDGTNWAIESKNIDGNTIKLKVIFAVTTTAIADNASCNSIISPDGLPSSYSAIGLVNTFSGAVSMKNTGTTTWKAGDYQLSSINIPTNIWGTSNLKLNQDVPPGGIATFSNTFTIPNGGPAVSFSWRMNKLSTGEWFGSPCMKTVVVGSDSTNLNTSTTPTPPTAPTTLSVAGITSSTATINWTPGITNGWNYIEYYQAISKGSPDKAVFCPKFASTVSCTLTGLKAGTSYTYTFRSLGSNGFYSPESQSITFKTTR